MRTMSSIFFDSSICRADEWTTDLGRTIFGNRHAGRSSESVFGVFGRAATMCINMSAEEPKKLRRDAAVNAERLMAAAVRAGLGEGRNVPLAQIAADAGVGVGTLYRRYPNREALLEALQVRAYRILLAEAKDALAAGASGLDSIDRYLVQSFEHRDQLVLPLHGASQAEWTESARLRDQLKTVIAAMVALGHEDGTLRPDVTGLTIVRFGAMLAQPMTNVRGWADSAGEQRSVFLRGIAGPAAG